MAAATIVDGQDGTSVLILLRGLPHPVTFCGCGAIPDVGDGNLSFSINTESLSAPAECGVNGDSIVDDDVDVVVHVIIDDGDVGDRTVADTGDNGDVGDDVSEPGFLASRGSEPFVLILIIKKKHIF